MNSFTQSIMSCSASEVIPMIKEHCQRLDVTSFLHEALATGSVFLFESFDGHEITVVTFGYGELMQGKSTQRHFILVKALETAQLLRASRGSVTALASIDCVAALPVNDINEMVPSEKVITIGYVYNTDLAKADEITSSLMQLFNAIPNEDAFSPFNNI